MRKTLKITTIVIGAIIVLLMIVPFFLQNKIESIIKEEGNKMLKAQFDFEELDISLLQRFPSASFTLKNFWLKGMGEFENDTLLQAGELTAAINILSLFGDTGYEINKIIIDDTKLNAIVSENGNTNWDIINGETNNQNEENETNETESSSFRIQLKKLSINDLTLLYNDRQNKMFVEIKKISAACSGDFGSERTTLDLNFETPSFTFAKEEIQFINSASITAEINADADFTTHKFTLKENTLSFNAIRTTVDGWIAMRENGMDMDIKLNSNEIKFKELLSLIPAIYAKDFDGLKADGDVTLEAFAKGKMQGDSIMPNFNVNLNVKNAMFRYPSLPTGVENINITANIENPGKTIDATTITINPFSFTLAGNTLDMTAAIKTPISDPDFKVTADGKLDLGKIKEVYPLEDMQLNGIVNADISINGRMSYIQKELYDRLQASGSIKLNDMQLQMAEIPETYIKQSALNFTPRYLELSETTINIGESDLTLNSKFENYLGFLLKGSTLKGTLNISSNKLNINDFMSNDSTSVQTETTANSANTETASSGIIKIPENIDFRMQAKLGKVLMNKMTFNDLNGLFVIKDCKADMQNLSLNTMGGNVAINGYYSTIKNKAPHLNAGFSLKEIGFAEAYHDLDMVQQLAPIFSNLNGNFSGNIKIDTELNDSMSPIPNTINGNGKLTTKDLSLSNVKIIDNIAEILNKPSLKETKVKDLNIEFTITDGRVNTNPFDLKLGDYTMNLSGSTGVDKSIDYTGKITIPSSAGNISKLGTVDMKITGNFTSPKVSIDMESLAKKAATNVIDKLSEKLSNASNEKSRSDSTATEKKENILNKALDFLKKK